MKREDGLEWKGKGIKRMALKKKESVTKDMQGKGRREKETERKLVEKKGN